MQTNILIILLFSILFPISIDKIQINGNNSTHKNIILREIQHPIPQNFSDSLRIEDQNRLYNLGVFSFVEIQQYQNYYQINVIEVPRYYPLPLLDFDESKGKEGTSYGLALKIINLHGKNKDLEIGGMFGNQIIYFLRFHDPWIAGDHISLNIRLYKFLSNSFYYHNNIEKSYKFKINGIEIGSGFNIGNNNKFNFDLSLTEKYLNPDSIDVNFKSEYNYYQNFGITSNYCFDTRNIFNDPTDGVLFNINLEYFLGLNKTNSYSNIECRINKFTKLSNYRDITLINRLNLLFQNENHIPYFKIESLGGEDFIRGYNPYPSQNPEKIINRIRASQIISNSIEIQYTLIEKTTINTMELGLDQIWFFDLGLGGQKRKELIKNKPIIGYGIGFRLFVSGVGTIGLDFGFNPYSYSPQMHISDGQEN
jgi:outer membrane protein assembly factor BamA